MALITIKYDLHDKFIAQGWTKCGECCQTCIPLDQHFTMNGEHTRDYENLRSNMA